MPKIVFIASDAEETDKEIENLEKSFKRLIKSYNKEKGSKLGEAGKLVVPKFIRQERFTNQYGAHAVAARMYMPDGWYLFTYL